MGVCVCRLAKLKELICAQTRLDPKFQEIFYENLPYKPVTPIMAGQLPVTTVMKSHILSETLESRESNNELNDSINASQEAMISC